MEVKHGEKRNSDVALSEVNQEFESQRFQLQQANRWADQAQRDKVSLFGELELRNRLFQESQAKDCQETEELRSICCEETDRARQARIDELSVHACQTRDNFAILIQRAALERPTFPVNPLLICVPGPCLAAILDCCTIHGNLRVLQDTFQNDHPHSPTNQRMWHLLLNN